ncbi:MAG: group III truncated hemoglobin [Cytophagales bacterium]|nr:group III truncated hemoglobin [Cytophagales bacterium]
MKKDITCREDVVQLVNLFYTKVKADELLFPVFKHVDWPRHLPTMYDFWSGLLLGDGSYQGNPFQKHKWLAIDSAHFTRWLSLFKATVEECYEGDKADEAMARASTIADVFQNKMGLKKP